MPDNTNEEDDDDDDGEKPSIWARILEFLVKHPLHFACFVLTVLVGLFGVRLAGYTISLEKPYLVRAWDSFQTGSLAVTIKEAQEAKKHYAIVSATYLITLEGSPSWSNGERIVHQRIVYNLRPLTEIFATNGSMFPETYRTTFGDHLKLWPGSETETSVGGGRGAEGDKYVDYQVQFDAPQGDTRTVITGSGYKYHLPLQDGREDRGLKLSSSEDVFFYQNDDDYIAELTVVVESETAPLSNPEALKSRTTPDAPWTSEHGISRRSSIDNQTTIIGRWHNLRPGDIVGLKCTW
jgi:hypothetical protein